MNIQPATPEFAKQFLNHFHPLAAAGSLRGALEIVAGYEDEFPTFLAVFTAPRSRWKHYDVVLNLSRLAWSPLAKRSATTFLRKCLRVLKRKYTGLIVTYALPGTEGIIYRRAGFRQDGFSSGASWSRRGPGERSTPETIGQGKKLKRFFFALNVDKEGN